MNDGKSSSWEPQILHKFNDVVWHVSWSITGNILAVSGGDNKVRHGWRRRVYGEGGRVLDEGGGVLSEGVLGKVCLRWRWACLGWRMYVLGKEVCLWWSVSRGEGGVSMVRRRVLSEGGVPWVKEVCLEWRRCVLGDGVMSCRGIIILTMSEKFVFFLFLLC